MRALFVSSMDFRQIAMPGDRGRKERLFRAAVTAFASLTRPSRNEIAQLEDLTLPLYEHVSVEGRRFAAAVLSEVRNPPVALVRRLAEESVDITAKTADTIGAINFMEGQTVEAGAILIEMTSTQQAADLVAARADLCRFGRSPGMRGSGYFDPELRRRLALCLFRSDHPRSISGRDGCPDAGILRAGLWRGL